MHPTPDMTFARFMYYVKLLASAHPAMNVPEAKWQFYYASGKRPGDAFNAEYVSFLNQKEEVVRAPDP